MAADSKMASLSSSSSSPHIVIFPFMSKGHTIPLLHLSHHLLRRGAAVTIFTTPANHPFISHSLSLSSADHLSIIDLPFPQNIPGIPPAIESTDKLPSISLFFPFVNAIKLMQPSFEKALEKIHPQISCVVSDSFLPWTLQSASKFGIPRLSFYGMGYYAMALTREADALLRHVSDDKQFSLTSFPWIKLSRDDFDEPFNKRDRAGPHYDFIVESSAAVENSYGLLVNSFYELEQPYADYWNRKRQPKAWSIGPLCLFKPQKAEQSTGQRPEWMRWLDQNMAQGSPVLYVAFGSQAEISATQLRAIAVGLEESEVSFLWVVKKSSEVELMSDCFGNNKVINGRGMIVNEWVDQEEILQHPIVHGFLSHCGWNSVLEGICGGVTILAWPMMADQFVNAKFVVEEIKIGLRVDTVDGSAKGFVTADSVKNKVRELMVGEKGKRLKEMAEEVAAAARKAVADGGSSWHALNELISEIHGEKEINSSKLKLG